MKYPLKIRHMQDIDLGQAQSGGSWQKPEKGHTYHSQPICFAFSWKEIGDLFLSKSAESRFMKHEMHV